LPLSRYGAKIFGNFKKLIRENRMLNKENIKKHNIDLMIAATAIVENYSLVSADSIYAEISGFDDRLKIGDWTY
jgi:predicted nucleic acid-binding protein